MEVYACILFQLLNLVVFQKGGNKSNGSFTLRERDCGTDSDSDPIAVVGSWNQKATLCSVKASV